MAKIEIDQKECLGCSFCGNCAPSVFEVDEKDFKCKVKKTDLTPEELKQVEEAARDCPVQAIKLSE